MCSFKAWHIWYLFTRHDPVFYIPKPGYYSLFVYTKTHFSDFDSENSHFINSWTNNMCNNKLPVFYSQCLYIQKIYWLGVPNIILAKMQILTKVIYMWSSYMRLTVHIYRLSLLFACPVLWHIGMNPVQDVCPDTIAAMSKLKCSNFALGLCRVTRGALLSNLVTMFVTKLLHMIIHQS